MSLLTRIKDLAREQSLSISKIEEVSNLGNGTIRRWDNSPPSCDKLLRVANMLNVTTDYLLKGEDKVSLNLSDDEKDLIFEFKNLDFKGRSAVMNLIVQEQERMKNEKNSNGNTKIG